MALSDIPSLASSALADGASALPQERFQLRLVIAVPVLLTLLPACFGLVSYLSFQSHWEALAARGAEPIAAELLQIHLLVMLALAVIGVAAGSGLTYAILRPLRALEEATRRVASGRLDQYAPAVQAAPELSALSRAFNTMIDRLNHSMAERSRDLIEGLPIGVLATDMEGRVTAVSPLGAEILGLPIDRLIGRSAAELPPLLATAARPLADSIARAIDPQSPVHAGQLAIEGAAPGVTVTVAPLREAGGRPLGLIFSFRPPASIQEVQAHLRRTDELASLGAFALGLAHELRNPLGAVKGLAQLLQAQPLPPSAGRYLGRMTAEIDRVDRFVSRLLELTDRPSVAPEPCDPVALLDEALSRVRQTLDPAQVRQIRLRTAYRPLPVLVLERERMIHALEQLVSNAYAFTPAGGAITLTAESPDADPHGACCVRLSVSNTGPSLAAGMHEKIFEPFFTTREGATGLGLTLAREIAMQNGGGLAAHCDGEGVVLTLTFGPERISGQPEVRP